MSGHKKETGEMSQGPFSETKILSLLNAQIN